MFGGEAWATPRVLIVGRGRLGRSLASALDDGGVSVTLVPGRDLGQARAAAVGPDLALLAVPDDAVAAAAAVLARFRLPPGLALAHLSGVLGLEPLEPLRAAGHPVGSLHPLRSFAAVLPPSAFRGVTMAVEASEPQFAQTLDGLARQLGAEPRPVAGAQRAMYHAAAVMASAFVVVLADQAVRMLETIGWDPEDSLRALLPLVRGAVDSLDAQGLPGALTGPLRRGDVDTVAAHLASLTSAPELADTLSAYRLLGTAAVDISRRLELAPATAQVLRATLAGGEASCPKAAGRET